MEKLKLSHKCLRILWWKIYTIWSPSVDKYIYSWRPYTTWKTFRCIKYFTNGNNYFLLTCSYPYHFLTIQPLSFIPKNCILEYKLCLKLFCQCVSTVYACVLQTDCIVTRSIFSLFNYFVNGWIYIIFRIALLCNQFVCKFFHGCLNFYNYYTINLLGTTYEHVYNCLSQYAWHFLKFTTKKHLRS